MAVRTIRGQIPVDCAFSAAIDAVQRYLSRSARSESGRALRLSAPMPLMSARLGLVWLVSATAIVARDVSDPSRAHEALWLRLRARHGLPFPDVAAVLTARPLHGKTTLQLTAEYVSAFGPLGRAFDGLVGRHVAKRALLGLLVDFKAALEADDRTFRQAWEHAVEH